MTDRMIVFFVPGEAVTQGSKRIVSPKGQQPRMIELNPARLKTWREAIAFYAMAANCPNLQDAPIWLSLAFAFVRPKSHLRSDGLLRKGYTEQHRSKPDIDKLARAALDALTGVAFHDDSQVCELLLAKDYTDGRPGLLVSIQDARNEKG